MINLVDGVIWCRGAHASFAPTSREVWDVLFEGANSIREVPTSAEEMLSTGLEFESSVALPELHTTLKSSVGLPVILCRLFGAEGGKSGPAVTSQGICLDYVILDNTWHPLPFGCGTELEKYLANLGVSPSTEITFGKYLELLGDKNLPASLVDDIAGSITALNVASQTTYDLPEGFAGKLFSYQSAGYGWLAFMHSQGMGCILADEMGLGKSVQIVCLVMHICQRFSKQSLIIGPATLLENWRREFLKFAPGIRVMVHRGPRRAGLSKDFAGYDVVVTSFETAVSDISLLTNITWGAIIVDEAQGIKNPDAKRTLALKKFSRLFAVAVTGTPVENSLRDLWSITDFVAPSLLGTLSQFEQNHPDTIQGAEKIEPRITPLILRRRVKDVAKDLPERIDIPVALELDLESAVEYERIRTETLKQYGQSGGIVALGKLRQFCAHPWLTESFRNNADATECSPKLSRLLEILDEIVSCGEKAIVFAAYKDAVDLMAEQIKARVNIPANVIDGRTPLELRQELIDKFSELKSSAVLVMIPKATGVGLNITAANHVIHYTPEWNPAVEDQASARAYRRGQQKNVRVHRLFYSKTVEEVMNDRMESKRGLADSAVIGSDGQKVEAADLLRAITISPQHD